MVIAKEKLGRSRGISRAETVKVSVYWQNGPGWTPKPEIQEYRFWCIGERTNNGWQLQGAMPEQALPHTVYGNKSRSVATALVEALSEALGGIAISKQRIRGVIATD